MLHLFQLNWANSNEANANVYLFFLEVKLVSSEIIQGKILNRRKTKLMRNEVAMLIPSLL